MAAIITDDFRRNQAKLLVNDIKASKDTAYDAATQTATMQDRYRYNSNYAIGLGKTDSWPNDLQGNSEDNLDFIVTPPSGTKQESEDVVNNLFTLKEVQASAAAQLIAKNTWTSGRKYKAYNAADNDCFYVTGDVYPSYVVHNNEIYLCLSNTANENATTDPVGAATPPTHTGQTIAHTGDFYIWAHIQTLPSSGSDAKFTTPQFAPVLDLVDATEISDSDTLQGGLLSHIGILDGGTGYTSTTQVAVTAVKEDGTEQSLTGYQFKPIISNGTIERIEIQETTASATDTGNLSYWTGTQLLGLKAATVTITDSNQPGSSRQATAFALISPAKGFAANALDVLPTWFVGCIAEFINTEGGDSQALKFRQVSLLKDFIRNDDADGTTTSYDALKYLEVTSLSASGLEPGDVLTTASNGSKFYFNSVDTSTTPDRLYYHQNSNAEVNFIDPATGTSTPITVVSSTNAAPGAQVASQVSQKYSGEYPHRDSNIEFNGEVIFHENRIPFQRTSTQTEEVKLIIQL